MLKIITYNLLFFVIRKGINKVLVKGIEEEEIEEGKRIKEDEKD